MEQLTIPQSWHLSRLDDLLMHVIGGDWGKDENHIEEGYEKVLCIRGAEFKNWKSNKGLTASVRKIKSSSLLNRKLQIGDVLLEISGGGPDQPVGRTVLIDEEVLITNPQIPKVSTNFLRLLRFAPALNSEFVQYYFDFFYNSGEIIKYQSGSNNLRNLKFEHFKKITIPIPPPKEQDLIVKRIKALFALIEQGEESLLVAQYQLKTFRQSILKNAFTGQITRAWRKSQPSKKSNDAKSLLKKIDNARNNWIKEESDKGNLEARRLKNRKTSTASLPTTELPTTWAWSSFYNAAFRVVDCHNKTAPYSDEGIYLIRTSNIKNGKLNLTDNIKFVTDRTHQLWSKRCVPRSGDILFTREAPVGEASIIPENTQICMGQRLMLIRTFEEMLIPKYLLYSILEPSFQKRCNDLSIGTGVQHLRVGDVENLIFPLAPYEEQIVIVDFLDEHFENIENLEQLISNSLSQIFVLRQSVLKKAFRGELGEEDQNDIPVSQLLTQIEKEKKEFADAQKSNKNTHKIIYKRMEELTILQVLQSNAEKEPISAKDVWQQSKHKHNIDEFYRELKALQDQVIEIKGKTGSLLKLTHAD